MRERTAASKHPARVFRWRPLQECRKVGLQNTRAYKHLTNLPRFGFSPAVLVVHYNFEQFGKMKREGDQVDVRNLKETFEQRRGCAFKELRSPTKDELFSFLGDNAKMNNFRGNFQGYLSMV